RAAGGHPIEPCFVTEFQRTSVPIAFPDGTRALAAIDTGRVYVPGREAEALPLSELELELETGDVARLFELALAIADDVPLAAETRSKAQRGYALRAPDTPQPMRARAVEYATTSTAAEALGAILRNVLDQIGANAAGVLEGDDPEWIHQLRVGVRRLRSALALARPLVAPGMLGPLEDEARWLASALGPARDLDVLVTATLPALADASELVGTDAIPSGEALATLAAAAQLALREARDEARQAVTSPRFQRFLLALGAAAATPLPAGGSDAGAPVSAYARQALRRRHRRLRNAGDHVIGGTAAQRHAARIAAKKLRYAAEFFGPSFPGRRAQAYRDALAALQETLGRLNDAIAAVTLASALTSPASGATALVAGWAGARMQAESRTLKRAWTAFAKARPFWKDKE
ncbi:MAG TPA: CHAD domain-containing protein, partial [Casimicrobiaceae bacterium]|nr:CHAD domain-containing protein [Casimicrobiaceae bacterium]